MTPPSKKVALYLRVSTDGQSTERQEAEVRAIAEARGWVITKIYTDHGISGSKGREKRPAFDALLKDAVRHKFDLVAAWSVDRLGRSLRDLVDFLGEVHAAGVDLYLHQQAVDTTTPAGRAMFQMLGVFAEFERAMIRERVISGLNRAKAAGKRLGRIRAEEADPEKVRLALAHLSRGMGIGKTARSVDLGTSVVQRLAKEMRG